MNLEPRMKSSIFTSEIPDAEVQMIPEVEVPIPACDARVQELQHLPYKCPEIKEHDHTKPSFRPGNGVINSSGFMVCGIHGEFSAFCGMLTSVIEFQLSSCPEQVAN